MTRILFSMTCALFLSVAFGQGPKNKIVFHVGATMDSSIQVIYEQTDTSKKRYIVFEQNTSTNTIFLSMTDNKFHANSCQIDQMQIDGKGRNEIHITWTYFKPFGLGDYIGGQTSWGEQLKFVNHEIWNLDTKERLFSAVSFYALEKYTIYHGIEQTEINTHSFWSYDFSINENGSITISNLKSTPDQSPDHDEGNYAFAEGKYYIE